MLNKSGQAFHNALNQNVVLCMQSLYSKNRRSRRSAKPDFCPFSLNYFLENFVRAFGANKLKYKNFLLVAF